MATAKFHGLLAGIFAKGPGSPRTVAAKGWGGGLTVQHSLNGQMDQQQVAFLKAIVEQSPAYFKQFDII